MKTKKKNNKKKTHNFSIKNGRTVGNYTFRLLNNISNVYLLE